MRTVKTAAAVCVLMILLAMGGCSKKNSSYTYTFVNQSDQLVTILIYRTAADYNDGKYPAITGSINAHGSYPLPSSTLVDSKDYYVDWYTSDLRYSNWADSTQAISFTPSGDVKTFYINPTVPNYKRNLVLSYDLLETNWIAVDAFDTATGRSVWGALSNQQKMHLLTLERGFAAHHTYVDGNDTGTEYYSYTARQTDSNVVLTLPFENVRSSTFTGTIPKGSTYRTMDSAIFNFSGRKYVMKKQY